jgi:ABC-type multidrug transport system fused ATPase/permease subunit
LKKLLIYLNDYKKESILGPLFKLLEASFELLVPLVMAAIIDHGIATADQPYIIRMCLILVGLGVVGMICSITAQYFAAKASAGFVKQLKHALFVHIQGLSFSEIDTLGTSTMITRMSSDMNQVQTGVNLTLRLLLRSPFVVFGAMLMAFTIDAQAALVFVVAIPALSVVVFGIMLWCIPLYKKVQARLDKVLGLTRENLTGARVIRAFCKEEEETREFEQRNEELTQIQKHVGRISALMNPATYVIINLAIICLIWVGAIRVNTGFITQGAVVALYNYMSQILVELIKLASLIITMTKSVACGNRIQDVFEIHSSQVLTDHVPAPQTGDNVVEFRHVNLRYQNAGEDALSDINFTVKRGETIGIIGGTGSGKSSLVHLIPRFYDASAGEILVDGVNVKDYPLAVLRGKVGVVLQKAVLFKGTIRENLQLGKQDASDPDILKAVNIAQARDVTDSKGGLDYRIEQGGKNLSGGQKQRFTIARALVKEPEILILDDSASALDFATDAALRKAIREMKNQPTVFIVSQRASAIQYADQIIVLDDGKIAGIGKSDDLLRSCQVYREIYESQYRKEGVTYGR